MGGNSQTGRHFSIGNCPPPYQAHENRHRRIGIGRPSRGRAAAAQQPLPSAYMRTEPAVVFDRGAPPLFAGSRVYRGLLFGREVANAGLRSSADPAMQCLVLEGDWTT